MKELSVGIWIQPGKQMEECEVEHFKLCQGQKNNEETNFKEHDNIPCHTAIQ